MVYVLGENARDFYWLCTFYIKSRIPCIIQYCVAVQINMFAQNGYGENNGNIIP